MDRIFAKLDDIERGLSSIRVEAATDRAQLAAHLLECTTSKNALHKRIDEIKTTQRWWSGKLIGAALTGGGFAEVVRHIFSRGSD